MTRRELRVISPGPPCLGVVLAGVGGPDPADPWETHDNPMAGIKIAGETRPQAENRVTLADQKDEFGLPRARITFSYCDSDRRLFRHSLRFMSRMLEAVDGYELFETESTAHLRADATLRCRRTTASPTPTGGAGTCPISGSATAR